MNWDGNISTIMSSSWRSRVGSLAVARAALPAPGEDATAETGDFSAEQGLQVCYQWHLAEVFSVTHGGMAS